MTNTTLNKSGVGKLAAIGVTAAMTAFTALPASAAPLGGAGMADTVKASTALPVENVKCRAGCAAAIGIGAGLVTGAIIANQAQRNRYYDDGYDAYDSGPTYYSRSGYSRSPGRCWVEVNPNRGTGYWTNC